MKTIIDIFDYAISCNDHRSVPGSGQRGQCDIRYVRCNPDAPAYPLRWSRLHPEDNNEVWPCCCSSQHQQLEIWLDDIDANTLMFVRKRHWRSTHEAPPPFGCLLMDHAMCTCMHPMLPTWCLNTSRPYANVTVNSTNPVNMLILGEWGLQLRESNVSGAIVVSPNYYDYKSTARLSLPFTGGDVRLTINPAFLPRITGLPLRWSFDALRSRGVWRNRGTPDFRLTHRLQRQSPALQPRCNLLYRGSEHHRWSPTTGRIRGGVGASSHSSRGGKSGHVHCASRWSTVCLQQRARYGARGYRPIGRLSPINTLLFHYSPVSFRVHNHVGVGAWNQYLLVAQLSCWPPGFILSSWISNLRRWLAPTTLNSGGELIYLYPVWTLLSAISQTTLDSRAHTYSRQVFFY